MNYAQIAAAVYQACNAFDPYLPKLSVEMAQAWGRQFEKYQFTAEELLRAVDTVYEEHGSGYRPLPKDITDAAKKNRSIAKASAVAKELLPQPRAIEGSAQYSQEQHRKRLIEDFARKRMKSVPALPEGADRV